MLWSQAAQHAAKAGADVAAFFPYYKDIAPTRALTAAGAQLFYGTAPPAPWWRRLGRTGGGRSARFIEALATHRPELVIVNQGGARDGVVEMAACRQQQIPYVIVNQAVEPLSYPDAVRQQLRVAFGEARHVWCVSEENLARLRSFLKLPLTQAEAIPNAYGCPFAVDCPWPADASPLRLAMVARLTPVQKGQDMLLDVLAAPRWRERDLQVTIFGDGDSFQQLTARRAALELESVEIPGITAPVGEIWARHHALLLPSRFEGQSLAMIEAMLHSRPVIATPVGGTAGIVLNGVTGFLAERIDARAVDAAMECAWNQRDDLPRLGQNAARHIRQMVAPDPGADFFMRLIPLLGGQPLRRVD